MKFGKIKRATAATALTMAVVTLAGGDVAGASTQKAAASVTCNIVNRSATYGQGGGSYSYCTGSPTYYRVLIECGNSPDQPQYATGGLWQHTSNPARSEARCFGSDYYIRGWTVFA